MSFKTSILQLKNKNSQKDAKKSDSGRVFGGHFRTTNIKIVLKKFFLIYIAIFWLKKINK